VGDLRPSIEKNKEKFGEGRRKRKEKKEEGGKIPLIWGPPKCEEEH